MCVWSSEVCLCELFTSTFLSILFRLWDFALERDDEEEAEFKAKTQERVDAPANLPQQLLFVHQVIFFYSYLG